MTDTPEVMNLKHQIKIKDSILHAKEETIRELEQAAQWWYDQYDKLRQKNG